MQSHISVIMYGRPIFPAGSGLEPTHRGGPERPPASPQAEPTGADPNIPRSPLCPSRRMASTHGPPGNSCQRPTVPPHPGYPDTNRSLYRYLQAFISSGAVSVVNSFLVNVTVSPHFNPWAYHFHAVPAPTTIA